MKRNAPLVFLLYALLFTALADMRGEVLALAMPLALYLLLGLYFAPQELDLHIERELSAERVTPQQPVTITLRITNLGDSPEELLLEDQLAPALQITDGTASRLCTLKKGESITWSYTIRGTRGSSFCRCKSPSK